MLLTFILFYHHVRKKSGNWREESFLKGDRKTRGKECIICPAQPGLGRGSEITVNQKGEEM
jgi:hypothetical protein